MPTALIVEDEPEANKLLSLLVQLRGYRTESAYTGGEALEKVEERPPDVVFLDLMLPDTNGFDVCRRIKFQRRTSLIPIVMVTARLAAENRTQSFRVGANEYVPKPYLPDQIFAALRAADAWRREIDEHPGRGEVVVRTDDEIGPFTAVTRLWSLLLARTDWPEDTIRQTGLALLELGQDGLHWGRTHELAHVATMTYEIQPGQLEVVLQGDPGWLAHGEFFRARNGASFVMRQFDKITRSQSGAELVLVRRFAPAPRQNGSGEETVS
jgi:DNA-binding response OmpR family regulator